MSERATHRQSVRQRWLFAGAFCVAVLVANAYWTLFSIAADTHAERCLPNFHVGLLVHRQPHAVHEGDLLFWRPQGALSGFHVPFILKEVAGVPGDHLRIVDGRVSINGREVVEGLPLAHYYRLPAASFDRDEIIPPGRYFMIGTHPLSNDSRYWGYLTTRQIAGFAYRLF